MGVKVLTIPLVSDHHLWYGGYIGQHKQDWRSPQPLPLKSCCITMTKDNSSSIFLYCGCTSESEYIVILNPKCNIPFLSAAR